MFAIISCNHFILEKPSSLSIGLSSTRTLDKTPINGRKINGRWGLKDVKWKKWKRNVIIISKRNEIIWKRSLIIWGRNVEVWERREKKIKRIIGRGWDSRSIIRWINKRRLQNCVVGRCRIVNYENRIANR